MDFRIACTLYCGLSLFDALVHAKGFSKPVHNGPRLNIQETVHAFYQSDRAHQTKLEALRSAIQDRDSKKPLKDGMVNRIQVFVRETFGKLAAEMALAELEVETCSSACDTARARRDSLKLDVEALQTKLYEAPDKDFRSINEAVLEDIRMLAMYRSSEKDGIEFFLNLPENHSGQSTDSKLVKVQIFHRQGKFEVELQRGEHLNEDETYAKTDFYKEYFVSPSERSRLVFDRYANKVIVRTLADGELSARTAAHFITRLMATHETMNQKMAEHRLTVRLAEMLYRLEPSPEKFLKGYERLDPISARQLRERRRYLDEKDFYYHWVKSDLFETVDAGVFFKQDILISYALQREVYSLAKDVLTLGVSDSAIGKQILMAMDAIRSQHVQHVLNVVGKEQLIAWAAIENHVMLDSLLDPRATPEDIVKGVLIGTAMKDRQVALSEYIDRYQDEKVDVNEGEAMAEKRNRFAHYYGLPLLFENLELWGSFPVNLVKNTGSKSTYRYREMYRLAIKLYSYETFRRKYFDFHQKDKLFVASSRSIPNGELFLRYFRWDFETGKLRNFLSSFGSDHSGLNETISLYLRNFE